MGRLPSSGGHLLSLFSSAFFTILGREGNLGSYITANTGLLAETECLLILTLSRAFFLGIDFALLIAELIILFL